MNSRLDKRISSESTLTGEVPAVVAWLDETRFIGGGDGLHAVAAAELRQDVADVDLDGGFAEEEPHGDLPVGLAAGYLDEDLGLPRGEVG